MSMQWIRDNYNVPAKRGMVVTYYGSKNTARLGTILRSDGPKLRIRLDGDNYAGAYHPTWMIEYPTPPTA